MVVPSSRLRRGWIVAIGVTVTVLGAGLVGLVVWPSQPSPDQVIQLVGEANQTLALLENQQLNQARVGLEALAAVVPTDQFVVQNTAVMVVLRLVNDPVSDTVRQDASRALEVFARQSGSSPASHWLAATAAMAKSDYQDAADHFAALVAVHPEDPATLYGLWLALSRQPHKPNTREFLDSACDLAPANAWLAVEWLRAVAAQLLEVPASGQSPLAVSLAEFESRYAAIAPFSPVVKMVAGTSLDTLATDCRAAIELNDAQQVVRMMRTMANLMASQTASDRREVERHPLEFAVESLDLKLLETAGLGQPAASIAIPVTFRPVTPKGWPPAVFETPPVAVLLEDFDIDGRTDIAICRQDQLVLMAGSADGWHEMAKADLPAGTTGMLAVDLDLDFDEARRLRLPSNGEGVDLHCPAADLDLITFGSSGLSLWENRADQTGVRSLVPMSVPLPEMAEPIQTATTADLDGDGRVDIVLATKDRLHIWINHGSRGFQERTPPALSKSSFQGISSLLPIDWDRDIDVDLLIGTATGVQVLENLRHGGFRSQLVIGTTGPVHALEVVDANADAHWDLVTAGSTGIELHLFEDGGYEATATMVVTSAGCTGISSLDYDNDGWLDLACQMGDGLRLSRGSSGRFADLGEPLSSTAVAGLDQADLDQDGDLDLALVLADGLHLLENEGGNTNHWLTIDLEAQQVKAAETAPSGRVNAHGLGSLLELRAGTMYQPRSVRRRTTHFGLGSRNAVDSVRVVWLNGVPQNLIAPATDLLICEQQVLLGSCPYVYGWNGDQHVFITDLLWAAPLGLQLTEGNPLPARPQEWIKLPGESLVDRDGHYELQITEELWEAAYFDEIRLLAVDHPPGVSVYSNEKVGPAEQAAFKVHTVRQPLLPRSACDHMGRDILPQLSRVDGFYPPIDEGKISQGRVPRHAIELDLGELADPEHVTLFLNGWTYPTTVALNLTLSRDPALGLPEPPALFVPNGTGWKKVLPAMGFPGGKTKTIAVDLSGLIARDDPRVRIETTMEIHWDAVFFTSGESPAEFDLCDQPLRSAGLHYRGFSAVERDDSDGPERFDYARVTTAPKWPPLAGRFTRYGNVQELLDETDDRLVVMAAGDELTLRFATTPCRPGWQRDFLLMSVGWDKDANLATLAGQSSEPLPFGAGRKLPPAPNEQPPSTTWYRDYLRCYQTRRQSNGFWTQVQRNPLFQ